MRDAGWAAASLVVVLVAIGLLLFKLIAYLRQSTSRYRWFELFTSLFLLGFGLLLLSGPPAVWSRWWAVFVGGSIFAGASSLITVIVERFWRSKDLRCSFCNRSQRNVKLLIAGPKIFICDECVAICVNIIGEQAAAPTPETTE